MKKNILESVYAFVIAALCFSVVGCSDYDNGFSEKDIEFGKDFVNIFGNVDPKQDWSMAKLVKVNMAVQGTYLELYSGAPVIATSKLLLSTKLGESSVAFNVTDGVEQVYAIVKNEKGGTVVQGFYDIQDGAITVTDTPAKKKLAKGLYTRATSDVTKGNTVKLPGLSADDLDATEEVYYFNNNGPYTYDELVQLVMTRDGGNYYYTAPFQNCVVYDAYGAPVGWDFTNATLDESQVKVGKAQISIGLTYLNNVEKWAADPWALSVGEQLFGYGGYFKESQTYYGSEKIAHYGTTAEEQLETLRKIESGFSITTTGGEIELPFTYGATGIYDQFGYVYYKEGDDPLEQPHYVLMDNATPDANIYFDGWGSSGTPVANMTLSGWTGVSEEPITGKTPETEVYGTKYKLAFFGENHDQTATYEFPEGYHIVFFISPSSGQPGSKTMEGYNTGTFNYSLPELNARIGHYYTNTGSPTYQQGDETSRGVVKAVAWEADGIVALGFEDSNDDDLNDIVFWLEGEFEADQELVKVEVATSNESESWVFACEDLGGSFDYDFNDVVWDVYKEYATTTTTTTENGTTTTVTTKEFIGGKVRLLAAGGTLPVELYYDEKPLGNVHELLGQQSIGGGLYHQVNVGSKMTVAPVELVIPGGITETTDINDIKSKFKVKVVGKDGSSHFVTAPDMSSTAPQIVLLPGEWEWPCENVAITSAYPEFTNWVEEKTWTDWANVWMPSQTVKRSDKIRNVVTPDNGNDNSSGSGGGEVSGGDDSSGGESGGDNLGGADVSGGEGSGGDDNTQPDVQPQDPGLWHTLGTPLDLTAGAALSGQWGSNSTGNVNIVSSNTSVVKVSRDGNNFTISAVGAGTATITISQDAASEYVSSVKVIEVNVASDSNSGEDTGNTELKDSGLKVDHQDINNWFGKNGSLSVGYETSSDGEITLISDNEAVVTAVLEKVAVPGGEKGSIKLAGVEAGTTTVTVRQAATSTYKEAEVTINVTVGNW